MKKVKKRFRESQTTRHNYYDKTFECRRNSGVFRRESHDALYVGVSEKNFLYQGR